MEIQFVAQGPVEGEALSAIAVPVFEGSPLTPCAEALDAATKGAVSRAIGASRFTGAKGQILEIRSFGMRTKPFPGGANNHLCRLAV